MNTTPEGVTTYVHADVPEPEQIIADARNVLNMNRPIAVMLLGILGHTAPEFSDVLSIIRRLMDPMPSGSYLVLLDGADAGDAARAASTVNGYTMRTLDEFRECFAGLELVEPGIVQTPQWRPDPG